MRIAVLGSWRASRDGELRGTFEDFVNACEEMGRELARREQTVILGGDSSKTADTHVARGMATVIAAMPSNRSRIEVMRSAYDAQPYVELAKQLPKHISFPPVAPGRWAETGLLQIKEADALITIAGAAGTYQAGLAAMVAKKTVVPIGSFGGASGRLVSTLQSFSTQTRPELAILNGPWTSHVLDTVSALLGVSRRPRLLIIHGRSDDRYKLTEWLRTTLGLADLLVMQQEFGGGRSLPEKFEQLAERADGAIALATPDDMVEYGEGHQARARQNVWLEVGWIWGRLGRRRVLLITKGLLDNPSDIEGLEYYSYSTSPVEASESIRSFVAQLFAEG